MDIRRRHKTGGGHKLRFKTSHSLPQRQSHDRSLDYGIAWTGGTLPSGAKRSILALERSFSMTSPNT